MRTVELRKEGGEPLIYGYDAYGGEDDFYFGVVSKEGGYYWFTPTASTPLMSCAVMMDIGRILSRINKAGGVESELIL